MSGRFAPDDDALVLCEACGADAFAIVDSREETVTGHVHLTLRCGNCGEWQDRTLGFREITRFREHHDATRRQITRVLVSMMRAESLGG